MYGMWLAILLITLLVFGLVVLYLITRVKKFYLIEKLAKGSGRKRNLIACLLVITGIIGASLTLNFVNTIVILIHLAVFWLLCDLFAWFVKKRYRAKNIDRKVYLPGILALSITAAYLAYGWYVDRHVVVTEYNIYSDKVTEAFRIVQFTDSHLGTTFDGKGFVKHAKTMNDLEPDIVVMTGDYVDSSSIFSDVVDATKAFGKISAKYGLYFVYGNHDKNYYGEERGRDFTTEDLAGELVKNGIRILEDEVISFGNGYSLVGRQDRSQTDRASMEELMKETEAGDYVIALNHQPNDYKAEAKAGVDLVLSGHTHGGHFFPVNDTGVWIGANDRTYGYEERKDTSFIVSSGISDWAIDFKTGCVSEIVVVNILPKQ